MTSGYEISPKVVAQGSTIDLSIRGTLDETKFDPSKEYSVRFFSKVDRSHEVTFDVRPDETGTIRFAHSFTVAGEYELSLYSPDVKHRAMFSENLFAVSPRLRGLRPFKGDLHIHTHYSDGRESPIYMAVMGRILGMDFLAITDHHEHSPSLEAIIRAKEIGLDMLLLPGEEISARESCGHFVSLGATGWVTGVRNDQQRYESDIASLTSELKSRDLVQGLTPEKYAHAVWTVNKIRELGGFAIIAHPYWVSSSRFDLDRLVYEQILADRLYDAIELFGDVNFEDNMLSWARYNRELLAGKYLPIVGNSDTHRADRHTYGAFWTTVFVRSLTADSLVEAIVNCMSVACYRCPSSQLIVAGPFDLVEYTYFLDREFFPLHDAITEMQGKLLMRRLEGKNVSDDELSYLAADLEGLYGRFFGD